MRQERAHRRVILDSLEMLGVDQFADSAVVIKCRLKVRAGSQWTIGREFKRRLKNRFDELGIEIPFPHQTVYFGEDRAGKAPPARVVVGEAPSSDREATATGPRHRDALAAGTA
jgi:small conductance mechanosensitive channel